MLEIYERLGTHYHDKHNASIVLTHEQRGKGRLKTTTNDGFDVGIFLDRGKPLMVGEYLRTRCGKTILVEGAEEAIVTARCDNWKTFSRACYHLGNRHVKIQVGDQWLRITPDHVLEAMLETLGLTLKPEQAIFIPELGAYSGGSRIKSSAESSDGNSHDHHHH